jgi:flagellar biosynthesis/type III secretory pathway M-ring protein FliF/YscJ
VIILMTLLFTAALVVTGEAAWQQWRFVGSSASEKDVSDQRSQREVYLERKAKNLAASVLDTRDIKVSVQVSKGGNELRESEAESKAVLILVNSRRQSKSVEQTLSSLLKTGLAIDEARGDSFAMQFLAFPSLSDSTRSVLGLTVIQRMYLGLVLLLVSSIGMVLAIHRYRQSRDQSQVFLDDYSDQLRRFKDIAQDEPTRVASVLSEWLNGVPK